MDPHIAMSCSLGLSSEIQEVHGFLSCIMEPHLDAAMMVVGAWHNRGDLFLGQL
jgi:hypothetical protein